MDLVSPAFVPNSLVLVLLFTFLLCHFKLGRPQSMSVVQRRNMIVDERITCINPGPGLPLFLFEGRLTDRCMKTGMNGLIPTERTIFFSFLV